MGAVLRDVPDVTIPMAYYYACHLTGEDKEQDTSADFIGYNVYRWGEGIHSGNYPSLLNKYSKYQLVKLGNDGDTQKNGFKSINIPVILTEFGRVDNPRLFAQVDWMFGAGAPITSGGMVFRMIQRPTEAEFGLYQTTKMTTPTTNGGLDNLIREYTEKKPLKLDTGVDASKNICDASLFPGIDNFELNPEKLPSAGSGSEGTHDLSFNSGDLQLPLDDLSINYQDNSGWHNAATEKNVTSNSNFQTKIPNPLSLQAIGVNFNGTNGACIVKPGSLLCKSEDCKELKVISAKWSSNGQGPCTLE